MERKLILFTESFPFGQKETFLETEIKFLSNQFSSIHIFPLHGNGITRNVPAHITVHPPFLAFAIKDQPRLFVNGLFNAAPITFIIRDFFAHRVYRSIGKIRVWMAASLLLRAAWSNKKRLRELVGQLDNSIVYSYWGDKLANLIPLLKQRNSNFTSVVRFHRTDLYEEFKSGHIPFRELLFKNTDHFAFISRNGQLYLEQRYPQWVSNSHLFRLGVSDQGINPANDTAVFHIVSCSYMVAIKRIPLLISALQRVDFAVKWTHIGSGIQWNEINCLAKQLPKNIETNLVGSLTNQEVMSFYQHNPVDLFINVSENEGVPVSIMEALSFGIPVIATNAGGSGEIVDDEVGALLPITVNDEALALSIVSIKNRIADTDLRVKARLRWEERCDATQIYSAFVLFLKSL